MGEDDDSQVSKENIKIAAEKEDSEDKENIEQINDQINNENYINNFTEDNRKDITTNKYSHQNNNYMLSSLPSKNNHSNPFQKQKHEENLNNNTKNKKKLKRKSVRPVNVRDLQKEQLANIFEKSESPFFDSKTSADKNRVRVFQINNNNDNSCFKKGTVTTPPLVSDRQKEIDRLAQLFEDSRSSYDRNLEPVELKQLVSFYIYFNLTIHFLSAFNKI